MMKTFSTLFVLSFLFSGTALAQTSEAGSYLWPYVIHTTVGSPSSAQFEARDSLGQTMPGTIEFFGYDPAHITVNGDGSVTGILLDTLDYSGTLVWATIDGDTLQFPANVKVLSQDYSFEYEEIRGEYATLYYPSSVAGEDFQNLVELYDYVDLLDAGYAVLRFLVDSVPNNGARQFVSVEPEENYDFRHCQNMEGTLRLTHEIGGSAFQSCFMIPYLPGKSPRLDVVYHEFGHGFEGALQVHSRSMGANFVFLHGWANMMFTAVPQILAEEPATYPLSTSARSAAAAMYEFKVDQQVERFNDWITGGAVYDALNSNTLQGLTLHLREDRSIEFYQRFFYLFQNQFEDDLSDILDQVENLDTTGVPTFYAALVSAVVKVDHSATFSDDYNFPIDQDLFDTAFDRFTQILDASIFTDVEEQFVAGEALNVSVYPNPAYSTVTFTGQNLRSGRARIAIYNVLGQRVLERQFPVSGGLTFDRSMDISSLATGAYYFRFDVDAITASGSFIVGE